MHKIKTMFVRDMKTRKVVDILDVNFDFKTAKATEKIDGMNVRVTMRNGTAVRLEKRRNPSKTQKNQNIIEPWYVDANEDNPADKWLFDALNSTDLSNIPDGEHSAEAFGENIQGNPLRIKGNRLFFFSIPEQSDKITFKDVPIDFDSLKSWLKEQTSLVVDNGSFIEGIVWHSKDGEMVKIKVKDF